MAEKGYIKGDRPAILDEFYIYQTIAFTVPVWRAAPIPRIDTLFKPSLMVTDKTSAAARAAFVVSTAYAPLLEQPSATRRY